MRITRLTAFAAVVSLAALGAFLVLGDQGNAGGGRSCPGTPYPNSCLGNGIVRSKEAKDRSLGLAELSAGTVSQLRRSGSFGSIRLRSKDFQIPPGSAILGATAQCVTGEVVLSGGYYSSGAGSSSIWLSYPSGPFGEIGGVTGWTVEVGNSSDTDFDTGVVFALCAPSSFQPRLRTATARVEVVGSLSSSERIAARRIP